MLARTYRLDQIRLAMRNDGMATAIKRNEVTGLARSVQKMPSHQAHNTVHSTERTRALFLAARAFRLKVAESLVGEIFHEKQLAFGVEHHGDADAPVVRRKRVVPMW